MGNPNIVEGVEILLVKIENLERQVKKFKEELNSYRADLLLKDAIEVGGYKLILKILDLEMEDLKHIAQRLLAKEGILGVLFNSQGQGFVFGSKVENDVWDKVRNILLSNGWRGSKEGNFLQGKIENPSKLIEEILLRISHD